MKKLMFLSLLALVLVFTTTPLGATPYDTLVVDVDPIDINILYWVGSDQNPSSHGQLNNSNEATEAAWADAIVGNNPDLFTSWYKFPVDSLPLDGNKIIEFNPFFAWDYVVVKYGNFWALYRDEGDNLLNTDSFSILNETGFGVSHVTFLNPVATPEPTTLILLGLGLIGVAGIRKKIKR